MTVEIAMPECQSALLAIRDGITVEELLVSACTKGQLSANDYFLRFQASLDSPEYYVAPRTKLLDNLVSGYRVSSYNGNSVRQTLATGQIRRTRP